MTLRTQSLTFEIAVGVSANAPSHRWWTSAGEGGKEHRETVRLSRSSRTRTRPGESHLNFWIETGHFAFGLKWILPGCEGFALGEIVLENFIACWDGLEDPRRGNAGLHDFHEILAIALVWGLRCQPSIRSSFPVSSELQFAAARLSPPTSYPVGFAIPNHDPGIREREFGAAAPSRETAPLSRSRAIDGGHRSRARSEAAMKVVLMLSSSLPPE